MTKNINLIKEVSYFRSRLFSIFILSVFYFQAEAQIMPTALPTGQTQRCYTMEAMDEAIRKNPGIVDEWKRNGERAYEQFLRRAETRKGGLADTIIIPVVFHLVDEKARLDLISDRVIYDQVEILNDAFQGKKTDRYKSVIPSEIFSRKGEVAIKFVLARRAPNGELTNGIERRVNTTPDRINIKNYAMGGLDPWDTEKYLNIWVGTLIGNDKDVLGVATFPFLTSEGPQGVVIAMVSLPPTTNAPRPYYPTYSEGGTLVHELGHYFYLYHTFGDKTACNNDDFRIQAGWPLPTGAGPEGDDTPPQKGSPDVLYGNPSMNYSDGCTPESYGIMYGSFMNYYDDRALFMFSEGHKKRILGCIELYRNNLANSDAATPPVPVTDAYVVSMSPYGSPERKGHIQSDVPFTVRVRNYGNTQLNTVSLTLTVDGSQVFHQTVNVNLAPGKDQNIEIGSLNLAPGNRIITAFTSSPNGGTDQFPQNDTLQSFLAVVSSTVTAPYAQDFSNSAFPPAGWQLWNPNNDGTWTYNATSGYSVAGSASMQFRSFSGAGQLDELVMPIVDIGSADSSILSFRYAYALYNNNTSTWDGLEIWVSNDKGKSYQLLFKKTGESLKTVAAPVSGSFQALPGEPKWAEAKVNLSPYLNGTGLLIKIRAVNAKGNNLYIDDVKVSVINALHREVQVQSISGIPLYVCDRSPAATVSFRNNGKDVLEKVTFNYKINDGPVTSRLWEGNLNPNVATSIHLEALTSLTPGRHILTVYSSNPNGLPDELPQNDTARFEFYVMGTGTIPLDESFESAGFPPSNWVIQPNGNGFAWERTTAAASTGSAAATVKNFDHNMAGKSDILISPILRNTEPFDSLFLTFDYAYAPGSNYPGSAGNPEDSLKVMITSDCGQSFINVFSAFGNEMVTVTDPENWKNRPFVARNDDWRRVKVFLTPIARNTDFQVFFKSNGNHRNNLYLDNVQVFGINVPPLLKEKGYLLYPSPFSNQFTIRNYEQPVGLQSIRIYNSTGQLIWQQQFNGNAEKQIIVNTGGWARGVYTVKMIYNSRTIVDRVVKQ